MMSKPILLCAAITLAVPAKAELLAYEEAGSGLRATIKIGSREYRLEGKMLRTKLPPGGALLVDLSQNDDLVATAQSRGMNVVALDLGAINSSASDPGKAPGPARAQALRDLIPRLRASTGARRVLARASGELADSLATTGALFDGLLLQDAGSGPASAPRNIEVWGSDAYWRAAPRPAPAGAEAASRRSFFVTGTTSGPGSSCAAPVNARSRAPALRALLIALDEWTKGVKPPPSRVPAAVDLAKAGALVWPKVPGLPSPPPGDRLVPKIDADGNETAGLRLPDQALPIATYTGFAAQKDRIGTACGGGAALPFPSAKADREKAGDPRLSLVERYGSRAYFVATMRVVADRLVKERLLLKEDADAYVAAAKQAPF